MRLVVVETVETIAGRGFTMSIRRVHHGKLGAILCAGVSIAALTMAAPARAADIEFTKAPVAPRGEFRVFVEGGAFWTGGDPIQYSGGFGDFFGGGGFFVPFFGGGGGGGGGGFPPCGVIAACNGNAGLQSALGGDPSVSPKLGWDGAAGFDYRFAGTNWHVNGQLRFGLAKGTDSFASAFSVVDLSATPPPNFIFVGSNTSAALTEWHGQADLGAGYDVITGPSRLQVTFGARIAEVMAKDVLTTGGGFSLCFSCAGPPPTPITGSFSNVETARRSFLGAGPRIGMDGSIPLVAGWVFNYSGDAALLFGNTKISSESLGSFSIAQAGNISFSATGIGSSSYWAKPITVVNLDMQAGFGYWFTPNWELALSYRIDAFLDALRQTPDDTLPAQGIDRYYHGPKVTLTGKFD